MILCSLTEDVACVIFVLNFTKMPSCFHPLHFQITFSDLTLDVVSNVFRSLLVETSHEHATRSVLHTLDAGLLSAP
jgi:hypothetical protein